MNLSEYPTARKRLYQLQFVVSGVILLVGIGFGAAAEELPEWYGVASAVTSALWTYLGITAASNVHPQGELHDLDEDYAL